MAPEPRGPVRPLVEHLFRHQSGQMLASLARVFGLQDLDLAEEAVQEAMLQALRKWPFHGIPANPQGWLAEVARNKALDLLRRRSMERRHDAELEKRLLEREAALTTCGGGDVDDDQLAMMFACCHPALAPEARVALTLKAVGGFSAAELGRAFLVEEATMAQRLVRAKRQIQELGITLRIPTPDEFPDRLDSVLQVVYLLFNEGYLSHQGEDLVRQELCCEAIRLGELLLSRPDTAHPKSHALFALMCLQAARLPARVDSQGDILLLADQDRSLWDGALLGRGLQHLDRAAAGDELSPYHLQAGIAAIHAVAPRYEATQWPLLLEWYDQLLATAPTPVVALNRAIVLAMVEGPEAGLDALEPLRSLPALRHYYLLPAARADMLRRLGRATEAAESYHEALADRCTEPERRFLLKRLDELSRDPVVVLSVTDPCTGETE
jgi:RNA polymerase sigma-70 factor (ECF subfamily)